MNPGQELGKGFFPGGLAVIVPVHIRQGPKYGLIAQLLGHGQVFLAVDALGRPVIVGKLLTGHIPVQVLHLPQLLGKGGFVSDFGHVIVVCRVIAHNVPLFRHPFDQLRVALDVVAHQEEGGGSLVLLQNVQNLCGAAVFIPGVEGQV